ncbi:MAG TPA: hypothetical protein DCX95_00360 [Elusimicrobia bacterium]|nr:hypothetical protein [Elusimicrobiota bacterium]
MSKILDFGTNFVHRDEKMSQKKGVRKMKKFLVLLLVLGMMMSGVTYAATTDSIQLTVVVGGTNYSVDIATSGPYSFGTVNLGAQQSVYIGTVSNNGNITSDWDITGINATNGADTWTLAAAVGADTYGLMIGTSAASGAEPTWNPTGGTPVSSVTTVAAEATTGFGRRLAAGDNVGFWSKLSMPTSSAGTGTYSFTVSLTATAYE